MTKTLSEQICEICGIEPKLDGSNPALSVQPVYPDFEQPTNYKKLQEIFINHDHSITLSKGLCAISNGDTDFVNDMYDTSFEIHGKTFLKAVCNYLTLWIEETTQEQILYGIYSEPKDTSHKLTREECIYPRGYDDLLENIGEIKQAIRAEEWKYEG